MVRNASHCSVCLSLSGLYHSAQCPQGACMRSQMAGSPSFLTAGQYSIVCTYHVSFIYSSVGGHGGCFCVAATMGNAAGKEGAAVSWRSWFQFLGWGLRGGAAGSCGALGLSLPTPQPSPPPPWLPCLGGGLLHVEDHGSRK